MDYIPIPLQKFMSGQVAPVDVYVCLGQDKYIKVLNKYDSFDRVRLSNYQDRKVSALYIEKNSLDSYFQYCCGLVSRLLAARDSSAPILISANCRLGEIIFQDLFARGLREETLKNMQLYMNLLERFIQQRPLLSHLLLEIQQVDDLVARRGIMVANLSMLLLMGMRWRSRENVTTVFAAALLHDVGLISHGYLAYVNPADMSVPEKELYDHHSANGAEILLKSKVFTDDKVVKIIAQHHELPDGNGAPAGIKAAEIFPLALPVIMSCRLADLLLHTNTPLRDKKISSAVHFMREREPHYYPETYWDGFMTWSKVGLFN